MALHIVVNEAVCHRHSQSLSCGIVSELFFEVNMNRDINLQICLVQLNYIMS